MEARFGDYLLDTESRQLRRGGEAVGLSRKAYDLLALLLLARPRAIAKGELLEKLWPGTFVVEANLSNLVAEIRAAIGDDAGEPRFVRTLRGFGYAFCGCVAEEGEGRQPSQCWVLWGTLRIRLAEGENLLGRHRDSVVPIDSKSVSRRHALIRVRDGDAVLEDLGSRNGTFLGESRIEGPCALRDGERIGLGSLTMQFRASRLDDTTEVGVCSFPEPDRPK